MSRRIEPGDRNNVGPLTVGISAAGLAILLLAGVSFAIYIKRPQRELNLSSEEMQVFYAVSEKNCELEDHDPVSTKEFEIPSENFAPVTANGGKPCLLGSGFFGTVLRGVLHTGFDEAKNSVKRDVAIKIPRIATTEEELRPLLAEININVVVGKHKNIVGFIGFCIEEMSLGKVSIILQLCEEGSLIQYLQKHAQDFKQVAESTVHNSGSGINPPPPLSLEETYDHFRILRWCQEVAEGMEFLASKGVLHADLAARNCLLDSNLEIKISDFGLSRKLSKYEEYVKKGRDKLPFRWMALESLKSSTFSTKSDVWSYGVLMWEVFSFGDVPFPTAKWDENFIENLSSGVRLSRPKHCPEDCYELMESCWKENPTDRPQFSQIRTTISDFRHKMLYDNCCFEYEVVPQD